jgi:sporulation protein YabP
MNTEQEKNTTSDNHLILHARKALEVRGVTDVISFDEQTVILDTDCGNMTVDGDALHIRVLNVEQGIVTMDGRIDAITYFDTENKKEEKRSLFGKLLR